VATIGVMEREDVVGNAARIGADVLGPALRELAAQHEVVGEVRGTGVFWAVELVADRGTREPIVPYAAAGPANKPIADLMGACRRRGLLPFLAGNRVHVVPPCTISADEARYGVGLLGEALAEVFG
jgi:taurine--2-oxoglutarate transaminase